MDGGSMFYLMVATLQGWNNPLLYKTQYLFTFYSLCDGTLGIVYC